MRLSCLSLTTGAEVLRCRRAASAAEFALLLPLLMTMLLGTFQVGMLMYSYNLMASTARDVGRAMADCTITDPNVAKSKSYPSLPPWVAQSSWVITPSFGSDISLTISVPTTQAMLLSYIPFSLGTLTTHVQFVKDPTAFGGAACS